MTTDEPEEHRRTVAERPVLGAMLTATPSFDTVGEVSKILSEEHWHLPAHATIYSAIVRLHGHDRPTNPITVAQELERTGDLGRCGGAKYLHQLVMEALPSAAAPYYAEGVKGYARLEQLDQLGIRARQRANQAAPETADEAIAAHVSEAEQLLGSTFDGDDDFGRFGDDLEEHLDWLEADRVKPFAVTGFADLDELMTLEPGQLVLAAARPAMGKSAFALGVAVATALTGRPVVFHSLEMGKREVTNRILAAKARVGFHHLKRGKELMVDDDWTALAKHLPELRDLPLWMDYTARCSPSRIRSRAKTVARETGQSPFIVLDYAQLLEQDRNGKQFESRYAAMTDISRELKLIPRELECVLLALAQLNRGPEQRADKRPMASDLRDTGALEQDADAIILLHRDDYYEKSCSRAGETDLIVAKHRNGPTCDITVAHQFHYSRLVDMAQS